jgi:threonine synthase
MAAIAEEAIADASRELASHGFYAEPTSAMAAAGLRVLRERKAIEPGQTTVLILTGSGLKSASTMTAIFG